MSSGDGLNIPDLDKWLAWLQRLGEKDVARMIDRILRSMGLRTLEYLHDLTPRRTGGTKASFLPGNPNNVFTNPKINLRGVSTVKVGSALAHVAAVNNGFQQHKGQFVPGVWQGETFHYMPEKYAEYKAARANGEKPNIFDYALILTGKKVEGAHMFEKALQRLEDGDIETIFLFELKRLWAELGNSGSGP